MRASTFATLAVALGLPVVGATAALADGYPIADLNPSADYVVTWDDRGGQNVLLDVRPMRRN